MATYTLDATVSEQNDIRLQGVSLGRYNGDYKEADIQTQYVSGDYRERQYTAQDTPQDATGRRWRWTATDIYGNTGSATVPEDRIQVSTDIVTCEDARIVWDIDGTTVSNATVTISRNGTTVTSFSASGVAGKHILGGGLEPETTYTIVMAATVDGVSLTGTNTFTTEACTYDYFRITNRGTDILKISGLLHGDCSVKLEYSLNGTSWSNWDDAYIDVGINSGSTFYLRGYGGTLSTSASDYFTIGWSNATGRKGVVSGDANFLLSRYGGLIETPAYSWYRLFYTVGCLDTDNLVFSGKVLGGSGVFKETFRSTSITNCPSIGVLESYGPDADTVFDRTFCQSYIRSFDPFTGYPENLSLDYTCQSCTSLANATVRTKETDTNFAIWHTFQDCTNLTTVTMHIPTVGLDSIDSAFKGCTSLASITLASDCGDFPSGFSTENNWMLNASTSGTLHKPTATQFPSNALPVGWTISNDVTE